MRNVQNARDTYLGAVDEFGEGDVSVVAKDVNVFESSGGTVLESDAEEVTDVGGRATAELDSNGGGVVGCQMKMNISFELTLGRDTYGGQPSRGVPW